MRPIVFGIDISDRSIEIISLLQRKGQLSVAQAGRREIPPGIIERGVIQDADALVKILVGFFDTVFGPKRGKLIAAAALPATAVYAKAFAMPAGLEHDMLKKAVALEAADVIPIPTANAVDDVVFSAPVGGGPQDVLYAMASKDQAKAYRNVLIRAGAQVQFLDSEDLALARGLGAAHPAEPLLIIDIGNRTTLLMLVDRTGLRMSSNIMFGGGRLAEALEKKMKIPLAEAEARMRSQGFDPATGDGRTFLILQQPAEELIDEIRKTLAYTERRFGTKVRGILLAGGTSLIPGLPDFIASNFQTLAVGLGTPFRGIAVGKGAEPADERQAVLYAAALGLAARAVGARASPGVNLLPDPDGSGKGAFAGVRRLLNDITSSLSMVTHGKKPHPRKKHADADEHAAAKAEQPAADAVESAEGAGVEDTGQPGPRLDAPSVAHVVDVTPPTPPAPSAAQPADADATSLPEKESADEPDFGLGIGDILRAEDKIETAKVDLDTTDRAKDDSGKLSIEDILNRGASGTPVKQPVKAKKPMAVPAKPVHMPKLPSGAGKVIALVVLVLVLFGAAATGIYMFVKKNGLPKMPVAAKQTPSAPKNVKPTPVAPKPQYPTSVSVTVLVGTSQKPSGDKPFLVSRIVETDVKASDTFPATGESNTTGGKSTGTATIVNTTSRSYTFVATTRLLSKEGVLFRMKKAALIPANGPVNVAVAADQPGAEGDIGPTTFTIPGLSPDLQKLITAKSDAAMSGGSGKAKGASAADISAAKDKLTEKLKKESLDNFSAMLADGEKLNADLVTSKEIAATVPKVGAAGNTFTATVTIRFRALVIPEKAVAPQLAKGLTAGLPSGMNAADFSLGTPLYTVQAYDTAAEQAEVRVEAPVIHR